VSTTRGAEHEESEKQRVNRELRELLEETRVVLPGLELLFGFLLILPFSDRFGEIGDLQRHVYLACLVVTAAASALVMSPSARHRLGFRRIDKEEMLLITNRYMIAGLIMIAISVALAVFIAASMLLPGLTSAVLAASIALWFALWWFVAPLYGDDRRSSKRTSGTVRAPGAASK
jgi:hypothetical protein